MPSANRLFLPALIVLGCVIGAALCLGMPAADTVEVTYEPDDLRDIANPERGIYVQLTSQDEQGPLDLDTVRALRNDHMTLILRMYYLKTFRDRPISDTKLKHIREDFNVIREAGTKCIIRFAYTEKIGDPDAPIDVVLGHMDQLAPILRDNADVILTAQAGFVGAWGEWHASTNDLTEPENARQIVNKWLDILPASRCVQLRTPRQKWMFLDSKAPITADQAFTDAPIARVGHHNDCFISSETDVGTYEDIEAEKQYLNIETAYIPMGGETCALTKFAEPDNARSEMESLHFTYLNLGWHPDVIKMWQTEGFFQEVKRRMGYRLSLVSMNAPARAEAGSRISITLHLTSTGFAAPVNPRDVVLILIPAEGGEDIALKVPAEPRTWLPGKPITVEADLQLPDNTPSGKYHLHLALPDPAPKLAQRVDYAIQLANPGLWDDQTGRHDLRAELIIE